MDPSNKPIPEEKSDVGEDLDSDKDEDEINDEPDEDQTGVDVI